MKVADSIKVANQLTSREREQAQYNHKSPSIREREAGERVRVMLCVRTRPDVASSRGGRGPSSKGYGWPLGAGKGRRRDLPLETPDGSADLGTPRP